MRHIKEEFDKLTLREMIIYSLAVVLMASAIVAIHLSIYIPPEGEVHQSILIYFGIASASAGSLLGISMHFENQLQQFKDEIKKSIGKGSC